MWDLFREFVRGFKDFQDLWIIVLAIFTFYFVIINFRRGGKRASDPELGELLWVDEGKDTKPFFNKAFKIFGKPDAMYVKGGKVTAIEYKSRKGKIHDSDMWQAMAAALAARGEGYQVASVRIKTKTHSADMDVPKSELDHYKFIKTCHEAALRAKNGHPSKALPETNKCFHCAYKAVCAEKPTVH